MMSILNKVMEHIGFKAKTCKRNVEIAGGRMSSKQHIQKYLAEHAQVKLNFGCGNNLLEGWLNCDTVALKDICYVDCSKKLPFGDLTADYIYSEHMIEHIPRQNLESFLKECRRVLKQDGKIRLVTPNFQSFVEMYQGTKPQEEYLQWYKQRHNIEEPITFVDCINSIFYEHGHRFIFDFDSLRQLLEKIGFQDVQQFSVQQSQDEVFQNLEHHGDVIGENINALESLVVEAAK